MLPLTVSGREPQACPDLISSGRGRKTTQQNGCPGENPTLYLHTAHPRVVMLLFPTKMKAEGEAHQGFPEPRRGGPKDGEVNWDPLASRWGSIHLTVRPGHLRPDCSPCRGLRTWERLAASALWKGQSITKSPSKTHCVSALCSGESD